MEQLFGSLALLLQLVGVIGEVLAAPPIQFRSVFVQVAPTSSLLWVKVISLGFFWFHLSIIGSAFCFFLFYSFCTFKNLCELL